MTEVYPEEFAKFFKAMSAKMLQKRVVKGDTWKTFCSVGYLHCKLMEEVSEYFDSLDETELLDVANYCAMLWCRKNMLIVTEKGKQTVESEESTEAKK